VRVKTVAVAFGETFGVLFPIVDPIGNAATFLALTADYEEERRRRLINRVVLFVIVALSVFALVGEPLLHVFGISLEALQIAGGIIVGYTGFRMITATGEFIEQAVTTEDIAFTPLAIPLLAGPGAMAALLALDSREADLALALPGMIAGIVAVGVCIFVAFRFGDLIAERLGPAGAVALSIVMGLIVLAIGVELVVHGIVEHGAVVKAGLSAGA
jgi:multiple antibiotic resistance protein